MGLLKEFGRWLLYGPPPKPVDRMAMPITPELATRVVKNLKPLANLSDPHINHEITQWWLDDEWERLLFEADMGLQNYQVRGWLHDPSHVMQWFVSRLLDDYDVVRKRDFKKIRNVLVDTFYHESNHWIGNIWRRLILYESIRPNLFNYQVNPLTESYI